MLVTARKLLLFLIFYVMLTLSLSWSQDYSKISKTINASEKKLFSFTFPMESIQQKFFKGRAYARHPVRAGNQPVGHPPLQQHLPDPMVLLIAGTTGRATARRSRRPPSSRTSRSAASASS